MSESFKQQIKNLKTKIQEKRQIYIEQQTRQNTEIDEINAGLLKLGAGLLKLKQNYKV